MTIEKIRNLKSKLESAEAKADKIETNITKRIAKIIEKSNSPKFKQYGLDFSEVKFGLGRLEFANQDGFIKLDNLSLELGQSNDDNWYDVSKLQTEIENINSSYNKLHEALQVVSNWENKLAKEVSFSQKSEQAPKVITDFLDAWEVKAFEWIMENDENANKTTVKDHLAKEKIVKLVNLTTKVESITGTITDARGLKVSPKGELTGVIIGEQGRAHVQSILAGGWNIQCYHLRTLVNSI